MNDFTREELQDLFTLIHFAKTKMHLTPRISVGLFEKIQSMIDNYCEHEWENVCCGCSIDKNYCNKCGRCVDDCREKAIALTKLEEAVMWAVKGVYR